MFYPNDYDTPSNNNTGMDESCVIGSSWDTDYSRFIPSLISSMITTQHSFPFPRFMDRNHLSWFDPIQLKQTHPTCRELISNTDCSRVSFHFTTTTYQSSTHQRITNTDSITIKWESIAFPQHINGMDVSDIIPYSNLPWLSITSILQPLGNTRNMNDGIEPTNTICSI